MTVIFSASQLAACCCCCLLLLFLTACGELEKPKTEPFYAQSIPPPKKEFRWSNGKMPKSFDPALAAAPPETDVVRAIYEGLTDTNPKTLETIPAIATTWTSSDDDKTWTFKLRTDAKWSNGEPITAKNFVASWKRLKELGDKVSHYKLLNNIAGFKSFDNKSTPLKDSEILDLFSKKTLGRDFSKILQKTEINSNTSQNQETKSDADTKNRETEKKIVSVEKVKDEAKSAGKNEIKAESKFGVEAIDNFTLKVTLINPDKDFPALAANPIFRPIYGDGKEFESANLNADIVTSGAFRILSIGQDGITLDRAENFWNNSRIGIERVRFVPAENAEKALEAYRAGDIDAVTNADFEPLAIKLLTPFNDFERTTHSALNFYEFNQVNEPFQDRRVREAMAISIERERLTQDDMDGASRPALTFLPFNEDAKLKLSQNKEKAKNLMKQAGFPDGENFPTVKLLINRNNIQQRIARSVARMWKENLNIDTKITVKESSELDAVKNSSDFDLIRRGAVLPTTDETANMLAIFSYSENSVQIKTAVEKGGKGDEILKTENSKDEIKVPDQSNSNSAVKIEPRDFKNANLETSKIVQENKQILTEADALYEVPAIPLYFSTSYSLVKPYILGFEINNLDAPSLKDVSIDNNWQPNNGKSE